VGYFSLIRETLTLTKRSLTKWIRNPFAVIATLIQAIFWLALFGNSFNPAGAISSASAKDGSLGIFSQVFGGAANYITFLTPGVIAIAAYQSSKHLPNTKIVNLLWRRPSKYS
jgi:hypothetical protein